MLAYLAAPFTHPDPTVVAERLKRFCEIDFELTRQGTQTVSPLYKALVAKEACEDADLSFIAWRAYCFDLLGKCGELIVIQFPGWNESAGIQSEIAKAEELQIPITFIKP